MPNFSAWNLRYRRAWYTPERDHLRAAGWSPAQVDVLLALQTYRAGSDAPGTPTPADIARLTGHAPSTVQRALMALRAAGERL